MSAEPRFQRLLEKWEEYCQKGQLLSAEELCRLVDAGVLTDAAALADLTQRLKLERRFLEEVQICGQLQHPGVVPVHEDGRLPDGRRFFVMKLIKGSTLAEHLKKRSDPSAELPRFLDIFEKVCQAVAYAHTLEVIHRDLKPLNIMVGKFS